jgi:D-alanyl-D-alanine carboxypeptidase/D-alanyl-D-alanine-endopeptidase (penicillin-binding protein 4)
MRLNAIAIAATTSLALISPGWANEVNSTAVAPNYFNNQDSIPLFVPPPENNRPLPLETVPAATGGSCVAQLGPRINQLIGKYPTRWGILVEPLNNRTPLYSHNADKYFIPASNVKIFTTAAALQRLDPQTRIKSESLEDWVNVTNTRSHNGYAQTLFSYMGGAMATKSAIAQLGVDPASFRLADGSGLSRSNVATPRALVETLRAMYSAPGNEVFHASLPVAGVRGTLRNRMKATAAEGNVYAKTGTLQGVRALSGYINNPEYGVLVFSILANNSSQSGTSLVKSIDAIVLQLSTIQNCN